MKAPTNNISATTSTNSNTASNSSNNNETSPESQLQSQPHSCYSRTGNRATYISHLRKGQQQKKSKPNPCVLMTGVITTILMTFIYLVTSSLHRTMLEENEAYQKHQLMYRLKQQQQQHQCQQQQQQQQQQQNCQLFENEYECQPRRTRDEFG